MIARHQIVSDLHVRMTTALIRLSSVILFDEPEPFLRSTEVPL